MYDKEKADRAVNFISNLKHTKGTWKGVPFSLLDWQEKIIRDLFGTVNEDGTRQYRTTYIEIPRKNGKALAVDTAIPTSRGWRRMGDISVGDVVYDENGDPCNVVAVTEVMNDRPCYRVVFSDGEEIIADEEHEWRTECRRTGRQNGKRFIAADYIHTTRELRESLHVGSPYDIAHGRTERNHRIIVGGAVKYPENELPIKPYTLGCWLGDGVSANASIVCSYDDLDTIENIKKDGYSVKEWKSSNQNSGQFSIGSNGRSQEGRNRSLAAELRKLGLLSNKHIPASYLTASIIQRLELLRGLMDTDGYCSKVGQCEYVTTSMVLADGVVELVRSLGYKVNTTIHQARIYGKDCGPKYRIMFFPYSDVPVFKLRRKAERQKQRPAKKTRNAYKQIVAVEKTDSVPVRCIQVDSASHLYLAGRNFTPTHNSELAAAVALKMLFADSEPGAEIYSAAADRDQASIVFSVAVDMVEQHPLLRSKCKVIRSTKRIIKDDGSFYRVLSADHSTKHGFNASAIIFDELHTQPNRHLWDVLTTSGGTRSQPLTFAITTAGYDRHSICYEQHEYAQRILDGIVEDPTFYPVIFSAPDDAEWTDEDVWHKANPALGEFRSLDEMRGLCNKAQEVPALQNTFRRLYLNQWTQQETRWLDLHKWDETAGEVYEEDLEGEIAFCGLDLASTTDIAAFVMVFPDDEGSHDVLPFFFVPEESMKERAERDRVPYDLWVEQGLIEATPGNVIDYRFIRERIKELGERFNIQEIAFDRWGATQLIQELEDEGFTVVQFGQGFASMSPPTKELMNLVLSCRLRHGGNPVLRWMADNLVVKQDPAGNLKPDKGKSTEKIDGMVALVMAIDRATRNESSVYDERELLVI